MSLRHVPFYSELMTRKIGGRRVNSGIVLVYGAIEVHSMGHLGCVASNKTIAEEVGLSPATVANYISLLSKGKWISIDYEESDFNHKKRLRIRPNLGIAFPPEDNEDDTAVVPTKPAKSDQQIKFDNTYTELSEFWSSMLGRKIADSKSSRDGLKALLKDGRTVDDLKLAIQAAVYFRNDKYKPKVFGFKSMYEKWEKLAGHAEAEANNRNNNAIF